MRFQTCVLAAAIAALCLCCAPFALAYETSIGEVDVEVSGSINIRSSFNRVRERNRDTTNNKGTVSGNVVLNSKANYGRHTVVTQLRPYTTHEFDPASDNYSRVSVDELYWNAQVTEGISTVLGRRQIVNGVALGYNPTDFLSHDKIVTGSNLTDTERRQERKGDNLVGFSRYFDNATFQAYLLFPNSVTGDEHLRGLAQFSQRIQPLQTDYTISAYYDDHLKLGLNIASTLSHSITGYVEVAVSEKRGRKTVKDDKLGRLTLRSYQDVLEEDEGSSAADLKYYDAVVGAKYTHESGVNVNVEYWRSNMGYTGSEIDDIITAVEEGRISAHRAEKLLSENNNQRQEKIFFRVSEIPLTDDLNLEQTAIYGLNDKSIFTRTALIWDATEESQVRFNVNFLTGDTRSEFGMSPYEWQFFASYKHYF